MKTVRDMTQPGVRAKDKTEADEWAALYAALVGADQLLAEDI